MSSYPSGGLPTAKTLITIIIIIRNNELEEQLAVMTKRKTRKRKRIQQGSVIEYNKAVAQVAAEALIIAEQSKKTRGSSNQERTQPILRRCRNCGRTGHNARTCKEDIEISSELDASITYIDSLFDSDENEDA